MPSSDAEGPLSPLAAAAIEAIGVTAGIVLVRDGGLAHASLTATGIEVRAAGDDDAELIGATTTAPDAFDDLRAAFTPGPILIAVGRGVAIEAPLVVVRYAAGEGVASFPHLLVHAAEASQITIVEVVISSDERVLTVPLLEMVVDSAANVSHVQLQQLGPAAWQLGRLSSRIARDATLSSTLVSLGGAVSRVHTHAELLDQGGTSNLRAIYAGDGDQMHDFRVVQGHVGMNTTSDLFFKGAVTDEAHAVYSGVIRVDKGAVDTNGFQTIRNLVLSDTAWADAVPNLEIEENRVRCSHATTVGPIDVEQRYYLEGRGVPRQVAERLIVLGFFEEVIDRLPIVGLRQLVRDALAVKVAGGVAS
ncbi:MAG TPA: SufD family Fe-S cluster assembly protein [Acidimicrobiales bacterium]|nr:SufD family Fe-S cluster assembly protein [Acidimicrobiales bacterium]